MRQPTGSTPTGAPYRHRLVQSYGVLRCCYCTAVARKQSRITRDLHTRQRLHNNRSASTPPKFHKPNPHAVHIPKASEYFETLSIENHSRRHLTIHKSYHRYAGIPNTFNLIDKGMFSALQHLRPSARALHSANASNQTPLFANGKPPPQMPCLASTLSTLSTPLFYVVPISINMLTNANTFLAYEAEQLTLRSFGSECLPRFISGVLFEDLPCKRWQQNLTPDNPPSSSRTASYLPRKVDIAGNSWC